jgi:hypothetical protein
MKHRLGLGIVPAALVLLAGTAAPQVTVGPNVQVSKARDRVAHNEVLLAADPTDPSRLLGCSMAFDPERNKTYTIVYASSDGGKSWAPTLETAEYEFSGDPTCALGRNGRAYYVALAMADDPKNPAPVYRSDDGGRKWSPPVLLNAFHGLDREYVTVDTTGGKYDGRVYVHATGWVRPIQGERKAADFSLFASRDGGASFWGPAKRASVERRYVLGVGNGVVLSDGTLAMVFGEIKSYWDDEGKGGEVPASTADKANGSLLVITSKDGGESLEEASTVSDFHMLWPPNSTSMIGYLAVDPGSPAFKDRIYAVWPDQRSGRQEILLSHSSDKGKTWSKPVVVNDDPRPAEPASARDHLMPTVAVNREGVVGLAWYDRRESADNLGWRVRFRASLDGGDTFLPSLWASEAASSYGPAEKWIVQASTSGGGKKPVGAGPDAKAPGGPVRLDLGLNYFQFNGGHTGGIAAGADGRFHPFWIDNRTGLAQLWTAAVTVKGSAVRHGSTELAALEDVSEKVAVLVTGTSYDRKTNRLTVRAHLESTSMETLRAPFKVRVINLTSELAAAQVANPDNGERGPGAVWDFSGTVKDGLLGPGEKSETKELVFRLSDLRPFRQGNRIRYGFTSLDARVLAKLEKKP